MIFFGLLQIRIYLLLIARFILLAFVNVEFKISIDLFLIGIIVSCSLNVRFLGLIGRFCSTSMRIYDVFLGFMMLRCSSYFNIRLSCDLCPFRTFGQWQFIVSEFASLSFRPNCPWLLAVGSTFKFPEYWS